jgi:hypothetical protein
LYYQKETTVFLLKLSILQAKLTQLRQQPDELNKQVFALLLLNRFIGENPFASESGGTTVCQKVPVKSCRNN